MLVLAIDPGPLKSAFVQAYQMPSTVRVTRHGIVENSEIISVVKAYGEGVVVVEGVACYGMPVGQEVFETCYQIGRFMEASGRVELVYRKDVKMHLCGSMKAKDANIRQALIDRFGGSKEAAIGTKKKPGPLYGIKSHCWSALAIAVTWLDKQAAAQGEPERCEVEIEELASE